MLHLLFESGDGNSELKGKRFPLGKNIYAHLKETLDNYKGDKSVEGYKRLVNIINMNDNEGGILYNEMKRIKNFFDNYNGSRDSVNYILNGGEPMENWVRNTLNTAIETVKGFKQAKAMGGLNNSFRKEHTKDRIVKPPKETKIKMSDINKNLLNVAGSGFKITKPNKVKSSVNEGKTFYITNEQISRIGLLNEDNEKLELFNEYELNYNKYQYLLRKPINKLTLDEITYLYAIHWIKDNPGLTLRLYDWELVNYIEKIKRTEGKLLTAAYEYFKKLKFPLKVYRGMSPSENINNLSGKKRSLSWTADSNIYSNEKSKFKHCDRIVEAEITPNMVQNEWSIVNFMLYSAKHYIDPDNNGYGEYELSLKPRFKHEKLDNLKQFR